MRRANGSGSVYKLSGNRHKPWTAKVTIGYADDGKQLYRYLGYYATKKEAQRALDEHFFSPQEITKMTVREAWEGWVKAYQGAPGTVVGYRSAYNRMHCIHDIALKDLTLEMMQTAIDSGEVHTYNTAAMGKKVLGALLSYGHAHGACPSSRKELLPYLVMPQKEKSKRTRFTDDEIQQCIDASALVPVILLFTGLRRSEFLGLKREDIDLEEQTLFVRKSKTQAGIRKVPIPDRLVPWIKEYMESDAFGKSTSVFRAKSWFAYEFLKDRTPHECRHTYISLLTEALIDPRIIKTVVGHSGGVTLTVYTHYKTETMLEAVNQIANKYLPIVQNGTFEYDRLSA